MDSIPDISRRKYVVGTGAAISGIGILNADKTDAQNSTNTSSGGIGKADQSVEVCSFNIRYKNSEDDYPWDNRRSRVFEAVDQLDPDLLGIQEAQPDQFKDLKAGVTDYEWYGLGREGNLKSEAVPIAWVKDRFEVLEKGVFWLSPTPEVASVGWGAENPRLSTWVSLHDSQTDTKLWYCNTHLSHVDETARINSARILRERAAQRASNGANVIITGDFNTTPTSHPYHTIAEETGAGKSPVADGRREADTTSVFGPWGTFHEFTEDIRDRIDYVFVPESASVEWYRTLEPLDGEYRSDHLPVMAKFRFDGQSSVSDKNRS